MAVVEAIPLEAARLPLDEVDKACRFLVGKPARVVVEHRAKFVPMHGRGMLPPLTNQGNRT